MARSPSHKFGQIIGDVLEAMVYGPLKAVADKHGLYLDYRHPRAARGDKRKVAWPDDRGNTHELDYVLEQGGSETERGIPKAFIETAWRRYTKHSRNKAQEIQGAVGPLAETFKKFNPFLGAVLGGVFTEDSLRQLRSHGFGILYIPYESMVKAFSLVGIDARFDENTPDRELQKKVDLFGALSESEKRRIPTALLREHAAELREFVEALDAVLDRTIVTISIATLHGLTCEVPTVTHAVRFIERYDERQAVSGFVRYEIRVRYSNGDRIEGEFEGKSAAIQFLRGFQ